MLPNITIFGIDIAGYGLMISIGIVFLAIYLIYQLRKYHVSEKKIDKFIIVGAISGAFFYLAASFFDDLWHSIEYYQTYGEWKWVEYGITFSGGLIGGVLAFIILILIFFRKEKYNLGFYCDVAAPGIVLAHAWGRIGCFLGGCCYGAPTDSWLGVIFPPGSDAAQVYGYGVKVLPTMLFESAFLFILFVVLFFFVKKHHMNYYLISYGVFRFLIEYLRGDDRGASFFNFLSPSQLISVLMIIVGVLLIFFSDKIKDWLMKITIKKYPTEEIFDPYQDIEHDFGLPKKKAKASVIEVNNNVVDNENKA